MPEFLIDGPLNESVLPPRWFVLNNSVTVDNRNYSLLLSYSNDIRNINFCFEDLSPEYPKYAFVGVTIDPMNYYPLITVSDSDIRVPAETISDYTRSNFYNQRYILFVNELEKILKSIDIESIEIPLLKIALERAKKSYEHMRFIHPDFAVPKIEEARIGKKRTH